MEAVKEQVSITKELISRMAQLLLSSDREMRDLGEEMAHGLDMSRSNIHDLNDAMGFSDILYHPESDILK